MIAAGGQPKFTPYCTAFVRKPYTEWSPCVACAELTLRQNGDFMKRFNFARTGTARKRLISAVLAVATVVTALAVLPIVFTTEVAAAAGGNAAGAFAQPTSTSLDHSTVFYAPQWQDYITAYGGDNDHLFGNYKQTNKKTDTERFYHATENAFVFRNQEPTDGSAVDPYVFFYPCVPWGRVVGGTDGYSLSADEYKYITITYSVHCPSSNDANRAGLQMSIYPITSSHNALDWRVTTSVTTRAGNTTNGQRIYYTAVFDLTEAAKWTGVIRGFRFDYFDKNDSGTYGSMVMFVDSFGFFKTMDEVEYHTRERDWVRNGPIRGYEDDYNDRNIFTAVSRSLNGYIHSISSQITFGPIYGREERAFGFYKPAGDGYRDPNFMFSIDGTGGKNQYDRSLPTSYKYVAISARFYNPSDESQPTINLGTMQVFLHTARGGGSLSEAMSVKITPGDTPTDEYRTFVFDLSSIVGNVDKIYGIRIDFTNLALEVSSFIDSIGFFKTREEAEAMGRATAYLVKGSTLYGDLDAPHNISVTKADNAVKFQCKANCNLPYHPESATAPVGKEGQGLSCGHLKHEYSQTRKTTQDVVVDPSVKLLFQDGGRIATKDYQYLVVTYQIPTATANAFNGLCPAHNCQTCDPNNEITPACFNEVENGKVSNQGAIPLGFHPCVPWPDGSVREHENFRIWQKITSDGYDVWITCALELTDQLIGQDKLYERLRGMRVDLFDSHIAKVNSYVYINEIKLVSTQAEAYEGVTNKSSDTYQINISTENNVSGTSDFQSVTPVKNTQTWGSQTANAAFSMTLTAAKLADMQLLRDHYDFVGWKAYYKNASGTLVEIPMTDGKFDISISSSIYTQKTSRTEYLPDNILTLSDYTLEVTMVAQWRLSTGLLTITPPSGATDEACLYRITGTATDSAAYTFTPLLVSGVSDGASDRSVTVCLPDGTYRVEMLGDWGWRYVGADGLRSGTRTLYGAGAITTDANGNSTKAAGKNATRTLGSLDITNPYLINGYGYGHATP